MADNVTLNPGVGGATIATDEVGGVQHELVKVEFGVDGAATMVSSGNPLPVTDALGATSGKQDTGNASLSSIDGKLTNPLPVSGTVNTGLSQPLTDAQLRTTPVPVSGTVSTGGLTDAELRASPVPVSVTGGGDATAANQVTQIASLSVLDDWDESDRAKVNPIVGQAGVDGDSGNKSAKTLRVVLATDQPALTNAQPIKSTLKPSYGATAVMTVTNLQSLASSATAGWQSARVSNISTLATDFEIMVKLTTANTAPANDRAMYVYVCPFYTSDGGSTWFASSQGTATLPTGTEGASTIASPNNLRLLGVLNYTTQQMVVQDTFLLSNCFGNRMPDGWSIIIINFSGAALSTGCIVDYSPINDVLV